MLFRSVHSGAEDADSFNPAVFTETLKNYNAFNEYGGLADWSAVTKAVPDMKILGYSCFSSCSREGKIQEINSAMSDGSYVLCDVGGHWVFVEEVQGNDVYMIDPAKNDVLMFDAYSNDSILYYEVVSGKTPSYLSGGYHEYTDSQPAETAQTTLATEQDYSENIQTTEVISVPETIGNTDENTSNQHIAEFYYAGDEPLNIYCPSAGLDINSSEKLEKGKVVTVQKVENGCGLIYVDGKEGWIDMSQMVFAGDLDSNLKGDINLDGKIDLYDLSLINEYLKSTEELPDGVSFFSRQELSSADLNCDGAVDGKDVAEYLKIISE